MDDEGGATETAQAAEETMESEGEIRPKKVARCLEQKRQARRCEVERQELMLEKKSTQLGVRAGVQVSAPITRGKQRLVQGAELGRNGCKRKTISWD